MSIQNCIFGEKMDNVMTNKEKFIIKDSKTFINMLYKENDDKALEYYNSLKTFAYKQKQKMANEIPMYEYENIINYAIVRSIKDFDESKKAKLQSYFWSKLRGEISSYRVKRDSLHNKIIAVVNEGEINGTEYMYQKGNGNDTDENSLEAVDTELLEDKIEKESKYIRQIKAFKMAFSGIPRLLQIILLEIGEGRNIKEVALLLQTTEYDISQKRNYGLSLVLQRIMRSHHITEEEKEEIAELHGFEYTPEDFENFQK